MEYECAFCGEKFVTENRLKRHLHKHAFFIWELVRRSKKRIRDRLPEDEEEMFLFVNKICLILKR